MSVPVQTRGQGDTVTRKKLNQRPSNVTLKVIMAVTGTIFALFVFVHMVGNLKAFLGPEEYNSYAVFLRTLLYPLLPYGGALWIFRIVLLTCLILHIWAGFTVWHRGRRARGKFGRKGIKSLAWGARTMIVSGLCLLAFIVVHLLDLTIGKVVASDQYREIVHTGGDQATAYAYQNLVASLSRPWMAIFYTLIMIIVGCHIAQGAWNTINDFGGTGPRLRKVWFLIGLLIALAIVVANGALPMLVLAGVIS